MVLTDIKSRLHFNQIYHEMDKHNLEDLLFSVWSESAVDPLREGPHQTIYKYLKKKKNRVIDILEVRAIDKVNNFSLDTMSVVKWLEWWERFVLPALILNDFNSDLMIIYPDTDTDLPKP